MRIAFVTEVWQPSINGVVTRLSVSVDALLAAGHEVLIVAPRLGKGVPEASARRGLTVRTVPSFRIRFVYGGQPWGLPLPVVSRHLREFGPDLVHVVNPFMIGIAGVVAARVHRWPLVASFHTDVAAYARFYHLGWIRPAIWLLLRLLHGAALLNLVTSSYSARLLADHGIGRIRLWRRGVDLERFHPRDPGADAADGPSLTTALYVGRLAYEKGLHRLLPLAEDPAVRLVMVGDGPDRDRLVREFEGTGTVFTGSLTGADLAEVYASADVFAFPSTTETLGLVILEALASGVPVVAAESPASHELLDASPVARLFPADRADLAPVLVRELIAGSPREARARAARAEAEGWGWQRASDELMDCYREVIADARRPVRSSSTRLPGSEVSRP